MLRRLDLVILQKTPAESAIAMPTIPQKDTPGTGGAGSTLVTIVALLFAVTGSDSLPVTDAILVMLPVVLVELTVTLMTIEDEALILRDPKLHVTVGFPEHPP
jgi:hypothetical protein